MTGKEILFAVINFLILAAGIYFFGRKKIPQIFRSHRDQVTEELKNAEEARRSAETLESDLNGIRAEASVREEALLADARRTHFW